MSESLTCSCGNQLWDVGDMGTRCGGCGKYLPRGYVSCNVARTNKLIRIAHEVETQGAIDVERSPSPAMD